MVYVIQEQAVPLLGSEPGNGPFLEDPQPMFGLDVAGVTPGSVVFVDDRATSFPKVPSALPAGKYRAQAVLDRRSESSDWQNEPGNLYSDTVSFEVSWRQPASVELRLDNVVEPRDIPKVPGVELFSFPSKLLSAFRGHPVTLWAGVAFPHNYDPQRAYAAVYEVPQFGGDAFGVFAPGLRLPLDESDPGEQLARNAFRIMLDAESGNGPTLFANSDNNGPCGDALVQELIPALEAKYSLIAKPEARLVRGHSTGGWASLWLSLTYPDVFGAAWPSAPDPVDFHRLQQVDIYASPNMFSDGQKDWPSERDGHFTIRQENLMEEVLGPHNTSAQQWDSWQAVWGRRDAEGHVKALYDPLSGQFDAAEAESYRRFDISERVAQEPQKYGPLIKQRVHLLVGGDDTYFLNEAVERLAARVEALPGTGSGYIKVLRGFNHHTIRSTPEFRAGPQEMLDYFRAAGVAR